MLKLSVIIPIYNAQKHLKQCLNSIQNQSFKDFEVILINDGSTDNSLSICDLFAKDDKRFKVFSFNNRGVSVARNEGILKAKGEWITFIDSDDYILPFYFEPILKAENADWILVNVQREINSSVREYLSLNEKYYTLEDFVQNYTLYPHFPSPWGRFFRKGVIFQNNIKYNPKLKFGEDAVFNLKYLSCCKEIYTANCTAYIYREMEEGLSKVITEYEHDDLLFSELQSSMVNFPMENFYIRSMEVPLTRLLLTMYQYGAIKRRMRAKKLSVLLRENYKVFLKIFQNSKVQLIITISYVFKVTIILDQILKYSFQKKWRKNG